MFFITEEAKETISGSSQEIVQLWWIYFILIQYKYKMTQYNTLKGKIPNSQIHKLKSGIKNGSEIT